MTVFEIDVISDFVCVWCYIGKKQLERAIALYQRVYPGGKDDIFEIRYRPYFLNYNPSAESVEKSILTEKKLAGISKEKRDAISNRVNQVCQSVGINVKWEGKIGGTLSAHRLLHLAKDKPADIQATLIENIFKAYHEEARDISSQEVLIQIACESGMDETEAAAWMNSEDGKDAVLEEAQRYRGIRADKGVPGYILQGTHRLEGSQDPQDFMDLFIQIKSE